MKVAFKITKIKKPDMNEADDQRVRKEAKNNWFAAAYGEIIDKREDTRKKLLQRKTGNTEQQLSNKKTTKHL